MNMTNRKDALRDQRAKMLAAAPDWRASDARVNPRVAIGSIIAMWVIYFLITSGLAMLTGVAEQWPSAGRRAIVVVAGILCTFVLYQLLQRAQPQSFGARLAAALGAVGHGEPVIEHEQIDRCIDDHQRHRGAERRRKPRAEALRLGAAEELVENEGAQDARDHDDGAASGRGPLLGRAGEHREPRGDQEIDQPHGDDRPDRDARIDAGVGGAPVGRRGQHLRTLVAQRVFTVCHIH